VKALVALPASVEKWYRKHADVVLNHWKRI
jgi:hypothetical protein